MKVGFTGLGHMGGPMSRNVLAAGHDLAVHDLRRGAAADLEAAGATWAATPCETGTGREVIYEDFTRTPLRLPLPPNS